MTEVNFPLNEPFPPIPPVELGGDLDQLRQRAIEGDVFATDALYRVAKYYQDTAERNPVSGMPSLFALKMADYNGQFWLPDHTGNERRQGEAEPLGAVACLYGDLNKFKPLNDAYGHAQGDRIITCMTRIVRRSVRKEDEVFHPSGDEIVAFLGLKDAEKGHSVGKLIAKRVLAIKNHIAPIDPKLAAEQGIPTLEEAGVDERNLDDMIPPSIGRLTDVDKFCLSQVGITFGSYVTDRQMTRVEMMNIADEAMNAAKGDRSRE